MKKAAAHETNWQTLSLATGRLLLEELKQDDCGQERRETNESKKEKHKPADSSAVKRIISAGTADRTAR
jgi:hypothetical protein